MSKRPTATDSELSNASSEFVWDSAEDAQAHEFVRRPVLDLLAARPGADILDLGCGSGAFTASLADQGYRLTGVDHSQSGIELARAHFPRVQFERVDLGEPLPDRHHGKYDAVVSIEVIEHLLLPRQLMRAAHAALRPGGLFILSTPYHGYWKNLALAVTGKFDVHWHPLRDFGHVKFFSRATLTALFAETGFELQRFLRVGRIPPLARSMIIAGCKRDC